MSEKKRIARGEKVRIGRHEGEVVCFVRMHEAVPFVAARYMDAGILTPFTSGRTPRFQVVSRIDRYLIKCGGGVYYKAPAAGTVERANPEARREP